eukprot:TRINITY_DN63463_c0_g1_i1.p1 TRINITY_DN63463_c0_g1~~TRINITY_DN63463_c0_g1_i1.p1  ORF type:complete len:275 (+),score=16.91 TRINITY_DN63463_c0_g1_i1:44-826(+)
MGENPAPDTMTCSKLMYIAVFFGCLLPPSCNACGGQHLYLFWDANCGSDDHHAGWILSPNKPDPFLRSNLHEARDGGCHNIANWASDARNVLGRNGWESWDGCCASRRGLFFEALVEEGNENSTIMISGLCDLEGGKAWANGLYNRSGQTTGGRAWYTSAHIGEQYDGSVFIEPGSVSLLILLGVLGLLCVAACATGVGLVICYKQRCCCWSHLRNHQRSATSSAIVVGTTVVGVPLSTEQDFSGTKPAIAVATKVEVIA